jgi:hypothetical protein
LSTSVFNQPTLTTHTLTTFNACLTSRLIWFYSTLYNDTIYLDAHLGGVFTWLDFMPMALSITAVDSLHYPPEAASSITEASALRAQERTGGVPPILSRTLITIMPCCQMMPLSSVILSMRIMGFLCAV